MEFANINHNTALLEYFPVILFIVISFGIIVLALISSFIIVPQKPYKNKLEPYECGFDAFEDTKRKFDIRFYVVAILFIIFDLEIIFLYPWALSLSLIKNVGFFSMLLFILMLFIGFIYEWKKGALKWD
ncbi:NADH-quinone oxidoreductase subunit A [Candidatus Hepatincolaceae symbiont of Richtersius coronifer]